MEMEFERIPRVPDTLYLVVEGGRGREAYFAFSSAATACAPAGGQRR